MKIIIKLILSSLAAFIAGQIIPGVVIPDLYTGLMVAVVLGVINTFVKPILTILTLPITILTFGLFSVILNIVLIFLVDALIPTFSVSSILSALFFGVVYSLINTFFDKIS